MAKIGLVSDLHLDSSHAEAPDVSGLDVLVVAGDIGPIGSGGDFLKALKIPVVAVLGNHDYWSGGVVPMDERLAAWKAEFEGSNVTLLEREAVEIAGVRFAGATMWSDYGGAAHLAEAAWSAMNDFGEIAAPAGLSAEEKERVEWFRVELGLGTPRGMGAVPRATPAHFAFEHERAKAFFREEIKKAKRPGAAPLVAVSHHAPSLESLRRFGIDEESLERVEKGTGYYSRRDEAAYRRAAYASNTGLLDPKIEAWLHGHLHRAFAYGRSGTLVACNPRGYWTGSVRDYKSPLELEVGGPVSPGVKAAAEEVGRIVDEMEAAREECLKIAPLLKGADPLARMCASECWERRAQKWRDLGEAARTAWNEGGLPREAFHALLEHMVWAGQRLEGLSPAEAFKVAENSDKLRRRGQFILRHAGSMHAAAEGAYDGFLEKAGSESRLGEILKLKVRASGSERWIRLSEFPGWARASAKARWNAALWQRARVSPWREPGLSLAGTLEWWVDKASGVKSAGLGGYIQGFGGPRGKRD